MAKDRIFLFTGGDTYQKEIKIRAVCSHYFSDQVTEQKRFWGERDSVSVIIEELLSYSLFSDNKIVILDGCDAIPKKAIDPLIGYLKAPRGDSPFLLFAENRKNISDKILDQIPAKQIKALEKTTPAAIREIVKKRCLEQQVSIAPKALQYFMDTCGDNAETAIRELEKICLWAGKGKEVTLDECQSLIQIEKEKDVWSVTKAIAAKNLKLAIAAVNELLEQGEPPLDIVRLLGQTFHTMYHCKTLDNEKVPFAQWAGKTGLQGFRLNINRDQSKTFSLHDLRRGLELIRKADEDCKGGKSSPALATEQLVIDLCHNKI